jgi:hypothetical protein
MSLLRLRKVSYSIDIKHGGGLNISEIELSLLMGSVKREDLKMTTEIIKSKGREK